MKQSFKRTSNQNTTTMDLVSFIVGLNSAFIRIHWTEQVDDPPL